MSGRLDLRGSEEGLGLYPMRNTCYGRNTEKVIYMCQMKILVSTQVLALCT
jgi:hypothetical protein